MSQQDVKTWVRSKPKINTGKIFSLNQAATFFDVYGIDIYDLGLPRVRRDAPVDDTYFDVWFEGLKAVPIPPPREDEQMRVRVTGKYYDQCRTGKKVSGLWKPGPKHYQPINVTVPLERRMD